MSALVWLEGPDLAGLRWAQAQVTAQHYLHAPVDARCSVEGYAVRHARFGRPIGCLLLGRPEATRCYPWYGSVADVAAGRAECTRWQVLNLARVWLDPYLQRGGGGYYDPELVPGFFDRQGVWRSTLASTVLAQLVARVGADYLLARPSCFLDEPYTLRWLLSYCDPLAKRTMPPYTTHTGALYQAAGFELYRTNARGLQTWRIALPPLTRAQDARVRERALSHPRSIRYRAARLAAATITQLPFPGGL